MTKRTATETAPSRTDEILEALGFVHAATATLRSAVHSEGSVQAKAIKEAAAALKAAEKTLRV